MPLDNELLFSGGVAGYPTSNCPIIRDDEDVLIYADRCKNQISQWTIRGFQVLGDGVKFAAADTDRAAIAAILIEEFDPDQLTNDRWNMQSQPIRYGVPVAVAVDSKPAIAAWLYVRGWDREKIEDAMDVSDRTVREYLVRFRGRGVGIPDDQPDPPEVGEIMPEIPPAFDPTEEGQQVVADGGLYRPLHTDTDEDLVTDGGRESDDRSQLGHWQDNVIPVLLIAYSGGDGQYYHEDKGANSRQYEEHTVIGIALRETGETLPSKTSREEFVERVEARALDVRWLDPPMGVDYVPDSESDEGGER